MRKAFPRSKQQNERLITRKTNGCPKGAFDDIPGSLTEVKYLENVLAFPWGFRVRGGSLLWQTPAAYPSLPGRTGYTLSKAGAVVTKTAGTDFSVDDIGNYVVHNDGKHDLITGFTSTTKVTVESSTAHAASDAAWVRGPAELWPHHGKNRVVLHIDNRFFITDYTVAAWTEVARHGSHYPSTARCAYREFNDFAILWNENGMFQIDLSDVEKPYYFCKNTGNPTAPVTSVAETTDLVYGYRYVYTMMKASGMGTIGDRTVDGAVVAQESGPVYPIGSSNRDYGTVFAARPVGEGGTTYAYLTGAAFPATYDTIAEWVAAGSNLQFGFTANGVTANRTISAVGIKCFADLAKQIELALHDVPEWSKITCEFDTNHLVFTNPEESGTMGYVTAGAAGTDIGTTAMSCRLTNGALVTNSVFTDEIAVGTLTCPLNSGNPEDHWRRYAVYRCMDIGINGINPVSGDANVPDLYVWVADIPILKPFTAAVTGTGLVVSEGVLQHEDIGATIYFQDGSTAVITGYTDAHNGTATAAGDIVGQTAAIGTSAANVMTASQAGTTVTRTAGRIFTAADVGRTIFWADGTDAQIKTYTSANAVEVYWSVNKASQAAGMDPISRVFSDIVRDYYEGADTTIKSLYSRAAKFSLRNRFWLPIPIECNCGTISNGFLLAAQRGGKVIYYSQMPEGEEFLAGYYCDQKLRQVFIMKDKINYLVAFINNIGVFCDHSITGLPTNTYVKDVLPLIGETIFILTGQYPVDDEVGCKLWATIQMLPAGVACKFLSSQPDSRILAEKGTLKLSSNLAKDRIMKRLRECGGRASSSYDKVNGYIWWMKDSIPVITDPTAENADLVLIDSYDTAIIKTDTFESLIEHHDEYVAPPT